MAEVEIVVAHKERTTLRVGNVFLKVDSDPARLEAEAEVMGIVPIPTPEVLWHKPSVLALAAVRGTALGRLGEPSPASAAAWAAAGAVIRTLHDAPVPDRPGQRLDEVTERLDKECAWLETSDLLSADLIARNREIAEAVLRPWTPVFAHGDLQVTHIFVEGDEVTGVIDWSEAGPGDAMYDLASLTLGHRERLDDFLVGYGSDADVDAVRGWWAYRSLIAVPWLVTHGFDPAPELGMLKAV